MAGSLPERRMLDGLVVVEMTLAVVLLVTGGLLLRAYVNLRNVDPGFRADGVATFRVSLSYAKYRNGTTQRRFYEELIARIRSLPGVAEIGAVTCAPFTCHMGRFYVAEGAPAKRAGEQDPVVLTRVATSGYFAAMGIRLVRGRVFAANDGSGDGPVPVVINEQLAKQLWPGVDDPIGRRFRPGGSMTSARALTVVGVVRDVLHYGLAAPMRGGLYLPIGIMDSTESYQRFSIVAHTRGDPAALYAGMRGALRDLDPELPMFDAKTMRSALNESLATRRAIALWLATFASIALTLAIGGIYAVLSYVVGQRRHEIGIRMALGAKSSQVLRHVVGKGLRLVAIGLVLGVPAAVASSRFLESLVVGI
jgi:predicted permease